MMMTTSTNDFFNSLRRRHHEPLLHNASGTVRFDLANGKDTETWYLTLRKGDITVSHKKAEADAVVTCDKAVFESMASGELNAMAAALRGVVVARGNLGLVLNVARLFPGAPDTRAGAPAAGHAKRMS
jgi:putative sterol carrier protein